MLTPLIKLAMLSKSALDCWPLNLNRKDEASHMNYYASNMLYAEIQDFSVFADIMNYSFADHMYINSYQQIH